MSKGIQKRRSPNRTLTPFSSEAPNWLPLLCTGLWDPVLPQRGVLRGRVERRAEERLGSDVLQGRLRLRGAVAGGPARRAGDAVPM